MSRNVFGLVRLECRDRDLSIYYIAKKRYHCGYMSLQLDFVFYLYSPFVGLAQPLNTNDGFAMQSLLMRVVKMAMKRVRYKGAAQLPLRNWSHPEF